MAIFKESHCDYCSGSLFLSFLFTECFNCSLSVSEVWLKPPPVNLPKTSVAVIKGSDTSLAFLIELQISQVI